MKFGRMHIFCNNTNAASADQHICIRLSAVALQKAFILKRCNKYALAILYHHDFFKNARQTSNYLICCCKSNILNAHFKVNNQEHFRCYTPNIVHMSMTELYTLLSILKEILTIFYQKCLDPKKQFKSIHDKNPQKWSFSCYYARTL